MDFAKIKSETVFVDEISAYFVQQYARVICKRRVEAAVEIVRLEDKIAVVADFLERRTHRAEVDISEAGRGVVVVYAVVVVNVQTLESRTELLYHLGQRLVAREIRVTDVKAADKTRLCGAERVHRVDIVGHFGA